MRLLNTAAGTLLLFVAGCNAGYVAPNPVTPPPPPKPAALRSYNGSATVGDFVNLTIDPNNKTIAYNNVSNMDSATVSYTNQGDGSYLINDPTGNLISAYEVPNYALVVEATKVGISRDRTALITAVVTTPIALVDGFNTAFNFMQLQTSQGGLEIGSGGMDSHGNITTSTYWPYGSHYLGVSFHGPSTYPASSVVQDPSGNFLKVENPAIGSTYIFAAGDAFVADRPTATFLGFDKASSKNFDPTFSGTYKTSVYRKLGASSLQGDVETGSASFDNGSLTISANGQVTITDGQKQIVAQGTLNPIADDPYLYNNTFLSLDDPCFGLFTFRMTTATDQQDVYVGFQGRSVIFSSFKSTIVRDYSQPYDYFYGVALRQ